MWAVEHNLHHHHHHHHHRHQHEALVLEQQVTVHPQTNSDCRKKHIIQKS
jgi:hypothetical protein